MSELPTEYEIDYVVYSASSSITEELSIWRLPYYQVMKRTLFKKFDTYVEKKYIDGKSND